MGVSAYLLHSGPTIQAAGVSLYTLSKHLPVAGPQHAYLALGGETLAFRSPVPRLP